MWKQLSFTLPILPDWTAFAAAMFHHLKKSRVLESHPEPLMIDEEKKILIFRRRNLIFAVNFNPVSSFADYGFSAPDGTWRLEMDSDEDRFDGFSRLKAGEEHVSMHVKSPNGNQAYDDTLELYLPSRCALVLKKVR